MTLRDILKKMAIENGTIKLSHDDEVFDLSGLLETLPEPVLIDPDDSAGRYRQAIEFIPIDY